MKIFLLFFVFVISGISYGQITGIIKDSVSNEAIRYVNIWVENEEIGTTSDEGGAFTLKTNEKSKTIVFSAVGYETKKMSAASIKGAIVLKPKTTMLDEVVVKASNKKHKTLIGSFKESAIDATYSCSGSPWILARYIEFDKQYEQTPYLRKIRVFTDSDIKGSKFNVRLYMATENGEPGDLMHDKNILGVAGKGKRITEIDITDLNIAIPMQGIFIAIEQLVIESNKFEYHHKVNGLKEIKSGISYEPSFGSILFETDQNNWVYKQGKWNKYNLFSGFKNITDTIPRYKDKYASLAMELVLSD